MMWRYSVLFIISCLSICCGGDEGIPYQENVPQDSVKKEEALAISIAYLRSFYDKNGEIFDKEYSIEGRVISSDQYGNFHKRLIIEDETGGIEIMIDMENYHTKFLVGMKLKIRCNSLIISEYGGAIRLGSEHRRISEQQLFSMIETEARSEEIYPLSLKIDEILPQHIGRWISLERVQFIEDGTWADGILTDERGNSLAVHTNENVEFSTWKLPSGSGAIDGILMVFNDEYQLEIIEPYYSAYMTKPRFGSLQNPA